MHLRILPVCIGLLVLLVDLVSKFLVQQQLTPMEYASFTYPYGGVGVFQNFLGIEFSLSYMSNRGAAWGVLDKWQTPLVYFRIAIVIGLTAFLLFFNKRKEWTIPLTLILTGALGNIIDFFLYGHVVDMFHFVFWGYDYPVFNVADSAIFIGIVWLFLLSFRSDKS